MNPGVAHFISSFLSSMVSVGCLFWFIEQHQRKGWMGVVRGVASAAVVAGVWASGEFILKLFGL